MTLPRLLPALMLIGLLCPSSLHAQDTSTKKAYESPEAVFEAAQQSFNDREWRVFIECVTPKGRDELIGGLAMALGMQSQDEASEEGKAAKKIVEKHLPSDFNPMSVMMADDPEKEMGKIVNGIQDPEGFFAAALGLVFESQFPEARITGIADLEVAEDGETASAQVSLGQMDDPDNQQEDRWYFEKVGDAWFITMP
jgi:hypothetical protein